MSVDTILWIAATACFSLRAFGFGGRVHFGWLGLAFVALTFVVR